MTALRAEMVEPADGAVGEAALLAKILGNASCATSGCHGGAGPVHGVAADFVREDPHARSFGALATPRSARMGESLGIADVTTHPSCTACHAPAANVPAGLRANDLRVEDGVGCASCHASTERWLRTHTRTDLTHAQKVAAGMRDLRSPLARAEACVACHQVIEPRLVEVGRHPRLIFELDGQLAAQPPHWRELHGWDGAKAWFVGQAVAWRESAVALAGGRDTAAGAPERAAALAWLVRRAGGATSAGRVNFEAAGGEAGEAGAWAREANTTWKAADGAAVLRALAGTASEFRGADGGDGAAGGAGAAGGGVSISRREQAYRAERLVLALDRLLAAWPERTRARAAEPALEKLFAAAQSVPDFEPAKFAEFLEDFALAVGE